MPPAGMGLDRDERILCAQTGTTHDVSGPTLIEIADEPGRPLRL